MTIKCPKHIKHRLLEVASWHAQSLLIQGQARYAEEVLSKALHADLEYARYYLESDEGANLGVNHYWAIQEAEKQGHTVIDILAVDGKGWTCSLVCQVDNGRYHYIHLDDGDCRVSYSSDWRDFDTTHLWSHIIPSYDEFFELCRD